MTKPSERYEQTRKSLRSFETRLEELRDLPAETKDGTRIQLFWATSNSPRKPPIASTAAPTASAFIAPNSFTSTRPPTPPRRNTSTPI